MECSEDNNSFYKTDIAYIKLFEQDHIKSSEQACFSWKPSREFEQGSSSFNNDLNQVSVSPLIAGTTRDLLPI